MQSPPASAEAHQRQHLGPPVRPPWRAAEVEAMGGTNFLYHVQAFGEQISYRAARDAGVASVCYGTSSQST